MQQAYGNNHSRLIKEFSQFVQSTKIKDDISISIQQHEQGESVKLADAFAEYLYTQTQSKHFVAEYIGKIEAYLKNTLTLFP